MPIVPHQEIVLFSFDSLLIPQVLPKPSKLFFGVSVLRNCYIFDELGGFVKDVKFVLGESLGFLFWPVSV